MATLYEINQAILDCIDFETGEIIDLARLSDLQIERETKIENVALWYKNLISDADALKAEKTALEEREKAARNKAENLKKWLEYALSGSKMATPRVVISFRKSESVEIEDEEEFINFAQTTNRDDLLTYKAPTANKTAIKQAIKSGQKIDGAYLIEKQNIQIK